MKNKMTVVVFILFSLLNLVIFQNCSPTESGQVVNNSDLDANENPLVTVVAGAAQCGQPSQTTISYGQPISICIMKAGNNPQYCISNTTPGNITCSSLVGAPGWTYVSSGDYWYKTFLFNANPALYFSPAAYYIEIKDTQDSSLIGVAQFTVQ